MHGSVNVSEVEKMNCLMKNYSIDLHKRNSCKILTILTPNIVNNGIKEAGEPKHLGSNLRSVEEEFQLCPNLGATQ